TGRASALFADSANRPPAITTAPRGQGDPVRPVGLPRRSCVDTCRWPPSGQPPAQRRSCAHPRASDRLPASPAPHPPPAGGSRTLRGWLPRQGGCSRVVGLPPSGPLLSQRAGCAGPLDPATHFARLGFRSEASAPLPGASLPTSSHYGELHHGRKLHDCPASR